jgi:hypothetical protein
MADTYNPYNATNPSVASIFGNNNAQYLGRANQNPSDELYRGLGGSGALVQGTFGIGAQKVGLANLYDMLLKQGRVDPRLLAQAQALNSRSTQQQQDAARAAAARNGLGGGGLNQALQAAIGSAGANRAANLNYQDIADSYQRNQENLGLLNQLVTQPTLGYASLGVQDAAARREQDAKIKAAKIGFFSSLVGGIGGALGGG